MACRMENRLPCYDLLRSFGVDPQLIDAGVLTLRDYAEDFMSRLGDNATNATPGQPGPSTGEQLQPGQFLQELFRQFSEHASNANQASTNPVEPFELRLDITGYERQDIKIKVQDNKLIVSGHHEKTSEDGNDFESRQFERRTKLPGDLELSKMESHVRRGQLIIRCPRKVDTTKPKDDGRSIPIEIVGQTPKPETSKNGSAAGSGDEFERIGDERPKVEDAMDQME